MLTLLAVLLSQSPPPMCVEDAFTSQKARVVSTSGGALQVSCVGGTCSGGGGSAQTWVTVDGGYVGIWDGTRPVTVTAANALKTDSSAVTQPVSGTFWQATQPVSGTLTCNAGTNLNTSSLALDATLTGGTTKAINRGGAKGATAAADVTSTANGVDHQGLDVSVQNASLAVTGTFFQATQPVSGTVTTTPPANASTNVAQFGGTNVSTGTGVGGAGIPRVTISSDSSLAANQSVNVAQINGVAPLMGVGASGTGAQRVAALIHDGTTTAGVIVATTALKTDLSSVAGTATATGNGTAAGSIRVSVASDSTGTIAATESGTWTVQPGNTANTTPWLATARIVGNTGAVIDAANNGAAPANVLVAGAQLQSGATATAGTAGQVGSLVAGLDHVLYSRFGGPVTWSCFKEAITAITECRAAPAAGLILYVTSIVCSNEAATVQGVDVVFGTGTNCGTGTTALTHKFQMGTNATTTSPFALAHTFESPLVPTAANAICVRPTAATAFGCTLTGYTAP